LSYGTSGTVGTVSAQPGQKVKKGDVLATLDQSSLSPQVISAQADLISAQNALDELLQSGSAKAQAQLNLANAQKALQDAQYARTVNQKGSRASSIFIQGAQANLTLAQEEVDRWQSAYNSAKTDGARAIALSNLSAAQLQLQSVQRQLDWYTGAPSPIDQAILDANVAQAQAALEDAQRAYDQVKDGPNPADVTAAKAKVAAAQATVDESKIIAPFDGTVTDVNIHPGDQAAPGTAAIDVADLSKYLVDVQVSEVDIDKVKVGQPATLTFDAILNKTYQAKVTEVSMTGTVVSGVVDFIVTVEVSNADTSIRPGMTAAVNITVSSVSGALLVPSRSVRTVNNQQVVFVLRNGKSTPVSVKLGASSDTFSQVVSGDLKEGDEVLVNPTATGTGAARVGGGGLFVGGGGFGGGGFRGD
jgi:HlyD family secretion protein